MTCVEPGGEERVVEVEQSCLSWCSSVTARRQISPGL